MLRTICAGLFLVLSGCASINLVATQAPVLRLEQVHDTGATRVEFDPAGKRMASGGFRGDVSIWSVPGGKKLATLKEHEDIIRGLVWLDADHLLTAGEDGLILVWEVSTGKVVHRASSEPVTAMTWLPQRQLIVTGHKEGTLRSWRYPQMQQLAQSRLADEVLAVAVNRDESLLAVADDSKHAQILDSSLNKLKQLDTRDQTIYSFSFSPDGKTLAAGSDAELYLWDLQSWKLTVRDTEHLGRLIAVDYSPDGRRLVSLGRIHDANLRIYDTSDYSLKRRLRAHNLCGYNARISPDGHYVASAAEDESLRLYDIKAPYQPDWGE
jgi:WD40 repeat protein